MIVASLLMLLAAGQDSGAGSSPEARMAAHDYGACVADASPGFAAETLAMDFRTDGYRRRLQQLSANNRGCTGRMRGRMRSAGLLFAGAVAERLVERGTVPVKTQLAQAAARPAAASFSPTDGGAICVIRSAPDDVAALFASDPGSAQEAQAAVPLQNLFSRCMAGKEVQSNVGGFRAILATAAFRSVQPGARS